MLQEFLTGYGILLAYFILALAAILLVRRKLASPTEAFRKFLHILAAMSVFVFTYAFSRWWLAVLAAVTFAAMIYPAVLLAGRFTDLTALLKERHPGEFKRSLLLIFGMFAILITVGWGLFGRKYLVIAAVLAWGIGDAAAALVGKRFGRNVVEGSLVDGRKTMEGTLAMFAAAFAAVILVLLVYRPVSSGHYVPIAAVTAAVSAAAELFSRKGLDTLICPLAAATVLIPLLNAWGL